MNEYQIRALGNPALPYASDAPVRQDLYRMGYINLQSFTIDDGSTARAYRARVRYLAALLPEMPLAQLAQALHAIVGNSSLTLSDMRMIIEGRRLGDASRTTGEVPIVAIQTVGRVLSAGGTLRDAARESSVSIDTVEAIDAYLGLSDKFDDGLRDLASVAVRECWTVRLLADKSGMSRSRAHRYMRDARSVLVELGELS